MNMPIEVFLSKYTEADWNAAVDSLLPSIHKVDRNAVRIWFRLYPLALHEYLASARDEADEARRSLAMQGVFDLAARIDSSHSFLYGHRYWRAVKSAIESEADAFSVDEELDLVTLIARIAESASASRAKVDRSLLTGIAAVGLMTLRQVGLEKFRAAAGTTTAPTGLMARSPEKIVAERQKDDSQGLLGFLKTIDRSFSVIYDEHSPGGRFQIMTDQEIASASAKDRSQNWQEKDDRCWEGPVPVECTSASCGTCWVGVVAGAEKLSEVSRRERRAMNVFGYGQSDDEKPIIRLACQAKAYGNVTIVIPPWNAVFGKKVYGNVEELELEPVTTSAKALREVVREAAASE